MFGDLNLAQLIGNITNDINVKYTPNGRAIANFGMATNRRYKLPDSNEWKDQPTFHNVVMFGNSVEMFAQRAHKGTRVFVQGYIQTRNWQDKEGKTQYRTEVVVDKIILLDRYERGPGIGGGQGGAQGGMSRSQAPGRGMDADASYSEDPGDLAAEEMGFDGGAASAKKAKAKDASVIDPDDLPF